MAYADYRDREMPTLGRRLPVPAAARLQVLPVTVSCADAWKVRRAIADCAGAGVVRCQVLLHGRLTTTVSIAPRVRLLLGVSPSSYLTVLQTLMQAVPSAELGFLVRREHLRRCDLEYAAS
jgi:hypothetical protein